MITRVSIDAPPVPGGTTTPCRWAALEVTWRNLANEEMYTRIAVDQVGSGNKLRITVQDVAVAEVLAGEAVFLPEQLERQ